jgi:hypothetical protein
MIEAPAEGYNPVYSGGSSRGQLLQFMLQSGFEVESAVDNGFKREQNIYFKRKS